MPSGSHVVSLSNCFVFLFFVFAMKSIQSVDRTSFLHLYGLSLFLGSSPGGGVLQGPAIVRRRVPALTGSSGTLAKIDHRNFWPSSWRTRRHCDRCFRAIRSQ
jgi:hypothetical protein